MKKRTPTRINKPRLYIFKSNKHIYAQVIDDRKNITLTTSSSLHNELKDQILSSSTCKTAIIIGEHIAHKLRDRGITNIIFDRGKHIYHGKVKALAEAARKNGINF